MSTAHGDVGVPPGTGAETPPRAAKWALWLTLLVPAAFVAIAIPVAVVLTIAWGDSWWAGYAIGYFGGPFILVGWLIVLSFGVVGLLQSIRRHCTQGVWMSLAPWALTVLLFLALR